jgi:hypothetical protein
MSEAVTPHVEAPKTSSEVRKFLGRTVLNNPLRGVRIHADGIGAGVLSNIDVQGDRRSVRVYHGQWTDLAEDGGVLWTGPAQVAVPLDDDSEPRIVVVADDFSRLQMAYELVVDELSAA